MLIKEGTNKAIVVNSVILYTRLFIVTICTFFTTRFALQALGVIDYGLFAVLGGVVALIDVANSVMINTTTRFMTVALGRGNAEDINQQFNINLRIHIYTASFTLIIALTVGIWFIYHFLNYTGDINKALFVYICSIVGANISMLGVPFNGLISAKENFFVSSIPIVFSAILKLFICWLLVYHFDHKLQIYTIAQFLLTIYPVFVFTRYCYKHYPSMVKFSRVHNKQMYKEVLSFSGWTLYGTLACLIRNQGAAMVINYFFTTLMNAALGIANTIVNLINTFAQNTSQPMFPQITKSYAAGNMERCKHLLCMTTKFSYLLILFISSPFLINADWILGLWLFETPPMAANFACLLIIDILVSSFNSGVSTVIKAGGKIWAYEFFGNTLRLIALIIAFFFLKQNASVEVMFYIYIICSLIVVIINQFILHRVTKIDNFLLIKKSYLPSIVVTIFFIPFLLLDLKILPILNIIIGCSYLFLLMWFLGLNRKEKRFFIQIITLGLKKIFKYNKS